MSKKLLFNFNREVIQNYTYVKYAGTIITATNTLEKPIKSAILKGQTLVNLATTESAVFRITGGEKIRDVDGYFILDSENKDGSSGGYYELTFRFPYTYNKTYTVMMYVVENSLNEVFRDYGTQGSKIAVQPNQTGVFIKTFNINYDDSIFRASLSPTSSGRIKFGFVMLEGDYANQYIPYFYGMQSVKMPVLKTLNNIVDFSNEKLEFEYGVYFGQKGDGSDWVNNKGIVSSFVYTLNYIELLPNQTRLSTYGNDTIVDRVVWFDENKNQLGSIVNINNRTLNIPTGAKYFRFLLNDSRFAEDKELAKDNIGHYNFYYGDKSQIFNNEPHKSNILTVNEDVTLRSNGSVYDELDLLTGKLTQRIDEDGEVLAKEVIKTVDLSILDQNENKVSSISSFNDTTHITASSETIPPIFEGYLATKEVE